MTLADGAQAALRPASGSSFYAAMRILPRERREAMMLIYGFCRAVDDIADDAGGDRAVRLRELKAWRRDLESLYRGEPGGRVAPLAAAIDRFSLQLVDFLAIVEGMETDVRSDVQAPSAAELDLYCDRVASAVGRLSVRVFGLEQQEGLALAHHLGRALQLTNILRDLDEDAALGRLYLPREELERDGLPLAPPAAVLAHPALDGVCERLAEEARRHFSEASTVMDRCPRRSVRAPRMMAEVYSALLKRLRARGWKAPRRKVRAPRLSIALAAFRHGFL